MLGLTISTLMSFVQTTKAKASTNANFYMVFDKIAYQPNEIATITFNLDQFASLSQVKLQIRFQEDYFEPVQVDNQYFYFSSYAIFNNDVINEYLDENVLMLMLIKDEKLPDGYFSSYKSNICNIKFKIKQPISNIYQYFTDQNYYNGGISLYLFDTSDQIIDYNLIQEEKIKIDWSKDNYEINVFDPLPNFKEDIKVANRQPNEYEYLVEKTVDTNVIGTKTIHVGIYDKKTADYVVLSKVIKIVDLIAPKITASTTITINDSEIATIDYFRFVNVTDNYDQEIAINIKYYDKDLTELDNLVDFNQYLQHSQLGYLQYLATDKSDNLAYTELISVNVIDTTAPKINSLDKIVLKDIEVDDLVLLNQFTLTDNYDENPRLVFDFKNYNNDSFEQIKEELKKGIKIAFAYFAIDESMNQTPTYEAYFEIIDTICPTIMVSDVTINDTKYSTTNFLENLIVEDNFLTPCQIIKQYFIDEVEVLDQIAFDASMIVGKKGYIKYKAIDSYGNQSEEVIQNIKVIDTTKPIIKVKNIANNQKYINVDKIEYEIIENFLGYETIIKLDNQDYDGKAIKVGKHQLYLYVRDTSGHDASVTIDFEVIEDNIIGCGNDFGCYINNYLEVVIITSALLCFIIIMIIVKIILKKRKSKIG